MLKDACVDEINRKPIFSHYIQKRFSSAGEAVAYWLGDAKEHKTHARPIGFEICRELGLNVTLLEEDQDLQERVLNVYHAMLTTHDVTNCAKFVENQNGNGFYFNFQPPS